MLYLLFLNQSLFTFSKVIIKHNSIQFKFETENN